MIYCTAKDETKESNVSDASVCARLVCRCIV